MRYKIKEQLQHVCHKALCLTVYYKYALDIGERIDIDMAMTQNMIAIGVFSGINQVRRAIEEPERDNTQRL
ncbi:MAG: hypothetical protein NVSMB49_13800 [Ktedonobacteraceae bacterium]